MPLSNKQKAALKALRATPFMTTEGFAFMGVKPRTLRTLVVQGRIYLGPDGYWHRVKRPKMLQIR